jgi:hypothetical protein
MLAGNARCVSGSGGLMTESKTDGIYYIFRTPLEPQPECTLTTTNGFVSGWMYLWLNDPREDIYTLDDGEPIMET